MRVYYAGVGTPYAVFDNDSFSASYVPLFVSDPSKLPSDDVTTNYIMLDVELGANGNTVCALDNETGSFYTVDVVNSVAMNAQEIWDTGIFKDKFDNYDEFLKERKERMLSYGYEATQAG